MASVEVVATVLATIMASIVAITGVINLILKRQEMRPHFRLLRRSFHIEMPIESDCEVVIIHPDKAIEKCRVYYNGALLPYKDVTGTIQYERYFEVNEGETFFIPKNIENENAKVVVMNGKKRLIKPIKFKDLPKG